MAWTRIGTGEELAPSKKDELEGVIINWRDRIDAAKDDRILSVLKNGHYIDIRITAATAKSLARLRDATEVKR